MIKIDKGIPLPTNRFKSGPTRKYPWLEMQIGDSFVAPKRLVNTNANARYAPRRFLVRTIVEDGQKVFRVWRVK